MKEKIFRYAKFNLDALLALAEKLRCRPCTCDVSKPPKTGSLNWVIFVSFDDGVDWVFRAPLTGLSVIITDETASKMLVSEAFTLKYLRAHSSIPVPEVFSYRYVGLASQLLGTNYYSGSKDNDIGIPYILQSKVSGRPLSDYDWAKFSREPPGYKLPWPLLPLSDQDRQNIMRQLGVIMSRLSEVRFEHIGSILEDYRGNFLSGNASLRHFSGNGETRLKEI